MTLCGPQRLAAETSTVANAKDSKVVHAPLAPHSPSEMSYNAD